jgi:hypothetical protein
MSDDTSSARDSRKQQAYDAISGVSATAYGFMGSQALFAALELGLFTALAEEACGLDVLAARLKAPSGPLSVLLTTCQARLSDSARDRGVHSWTACWLAWASDAAGADARFLAFDSVTRPGRRFRGLCHRSGHSCPDALRNRV